jgi:hypothetical protein
MFPCPALRSSCHPLPDSLSILHHLNYASELVGFSPKSKCTSQKEEEGVLRTIGIGGIRKTQRRMLPPILEDKFALGFPPCSYSY